MLVVFRNDRQHAFATPREGRGVSPSRRVCLISATGLSPRVMTTSSPGQQFFDDFSRDRWICASSNVIDCMAPFLSGDSQPGLEPASTIPDYYTWRRGTHPVLMTARLPDGSDGSPRSTIERSRSHRSRSRSGGSTRLRGRARPASPGGSACTRPSLRPGLRAGGQVFARGAIVSAMTINCQWPWRSRNKTSQAPGRRSATMGSHPISADRECKIVFDGGRFGGPERLGGGASHQASIRRTASRIRPRFAAGICRSAARIAIEPSASPRRQPGWRRIAADQGVEPSGAGRQARGGVEVQVSGRRGGRDAS